MQAPSSQESLPTQVLSKQDSVSVPLSSPDPSPSPPQSNQLAPGPPPRTRTSYHAITTPRPTLLFAIASDDPVAVERVLASGDAAPNDDVGPQSALEFALRNESLTKKTEIVKVLLAYGADPSAVKGVDGVANSGGDEKGKGKHVTIEEPQKESDESETIEDVEPQKGKDANEALNPAMK